uniref:Uncharacterized protein n=1 Tax=Arundo donax TaxID=35708 RepID=A0A0A9HRK3_ARUDO
MISCCPANCEMDVSYTNWSKLFCKCFESIASQKPKKKIIIHIILERPNPPFA